VDNVFLVAHHFQEKRGKLMSKTKHFSPKMKYVSLIFVTIFGLYGCAHARLTKTLTAQGQIMNSYERPGGDEIHIVKSPDGIIGKYRMYPYKTGLLQIFPHWRYEQLYAVDTRLKICHAGTTSNIIDCSKLASDSDLSIYIRADWK